ncbi:MAG: threonine synthase [Caldicoprobacter oshimai]|uniref:Threonine synthase n=1 Tax=Caldicoprobacter faecalis TaxID=937334 RepID=A0A1I5Y3S4_9FIRM|nr:threonine synthase [Caldicoprobacter faecalis]PZN11076.1 MAG: threonine synthase [Caldicoprobacter oshimai]SFQ38871.1 L-threonine synthase [Caldicoprobacter faecalis]
MLYKSTRGGDANLPSMDVIKQGIASDGGLFVPDEIPGLSMDDFRMLAQEGYRERAVKVLSLFLTDYSQEDLTRCVYSAYNLEKFDVPDIAPVLKLDDQLYILELWHGPTCAFKDMALQLLPHLMVTAAKRTGEKDDIVILVATSGDTGKAALEGFKDVSGTHVVVFYPKEGVSSMQQLQMITQEGANVHVVAVEGNFDSAQSGVKAIFADKQLEQKMEQKGYRFSSANSINWGRLVPQIVYYISAWLNMLKAGEISEDQLVDVVVPTGNFGNILAAYYAKRMGVPIHRLICASNRNKVLADFINTGIYDRRREFYKTISPSMDILISSNLERLLFELSGGDHERVKTWMASLQSEGQYRIDDDSLHRLQEVFWGGYADDAQTLQAIRSTYQEYNYVLDPHTAVGKWVYDEYRRQTGDDHKAILASTASPFKFAGDVLRAILGQDAVEGRGEFELLDVLSRVSGLNIPLSLAGLKEKNIRHTISCRQDQMKDVVIELLKIDEV